MKTPPIVKGHEGAQWCGLSWHRYADLKRLVDSTPSRVWRFAELDSHVREMEQMIFSLDGDDASSDLFISGMAEAERTLQQIAYSNWETELERRFSHEASKGRQIDDYALASRFRRLIERELTLLEAGGPPERVLFVGSGPVPVSAILIYDYLGIAVDCVDADPLAVSYSRDLLSRFGLSDSIRVHHSDGSVIDARAYDSIVIALLAKPKSSILEHFADVARKDCRIVCRTARGLRRLVYEPMDMAKDLTSHTVIDARWAVNEGDTISSVLLGPLGP